jgi:hypothetical protein
MENVKSKSDNIKFDVQATLLTIENDELLDDTFRGFCSIDYPKLHKMNEDGILNDKVKTDIKEMFKLILKHSAEDYLMFAKRLGVYNGHVKEVESNDSGQITEQVVDNLLLVTDGYKVEHKTLHENVGLSNTDQEPTKKQPNRPRVRINKSKVQEVMKTDKAICHKGALATLRLKNLHPRLERAYANETIHNELLTEDQWKQIIGLIDTTEQKLNQILKGK